MYHVWNTENYDLQIHYTGTFKRCFDKVHELLGLTSRDDLVVCVQGDDYKFYRQPSRLGQSALYIISPAGSL